MKKKLILIVCIFLLLFNSSAFAVWMDAKVGSTVTVYFIEKETVVEPGMIHKFTITNQMYRFGLKQDGLAGLLQNFKSPPDYEIRTNLKVTESFGYVGEKFRQERTLYCYAEEEFIGNFFGPATDRCLQKGDCIWDATWLIKLAATEELDEVWCGRMDERLEVNAFTKLPIEVSIIGLSFDGVHDSKGYNLGIRIYDESRNKWAEVELIPDSPEDAESMNRLYGPFSNIPLEGDKRFYYHGPDPSYFFTAYGGYAGEEITTDDEDKIRVGEITKTRHKEITEEMAKEIEKALEGFEEEAELLPEVPRFSLSITNYTDAQSIDVKIRKFNPNLGPSGSWEDWGKGTDPVQGEYFIEFPSGDGDKYTFHIDYTVKTGPEAGERKSLDVDFSLIVKSDGKIINEATLKEFDNANIYLEIVEPPEKAEIDKPKPPPQPKPKPKPEPKPPTPDMSLGDPVVGLRINNLDKLKARTGYTIYDIIESIQVVNNDGEIVAMKANGKIEAEPHNSNIVVILGLKKDETYNINITGKFKNKTLRAYTVK